MPSRFIEIENTNVFSTLKNTSNLANVEGPNTVSSVFLISGMVLVILHSFVVRLIAQKRMNTWRMKRFHVD